MHGERNECDATGAAAHQFHLSTALVGLALAACVFASARYYEFGDYARRYADGFREAPWYGSMNLAIYVCLTWRCAGFFRRQISEDVSALPTNGAYLGTVYGGALYGMTLALWHLRTGDPLNFAVVLFFCGLVGAGWAVVPATLVRMVFEFFIPVDMASRRQAAAVGAVIGGMAGYGALMVFYLWSPVGLLPAAFGAACGARGAYVRALMLERRVEARRRTAERFRKRITDWIEPAGGPVSQRDETPRQEFENPT